MNNKERPAAIEARPMLPAVFVGQVLYRERTSRYSEPEITEHTVTKIGRKYFEVTGLNDKINISNLKFSLAMEFYFTQMGKRTQLTIPMNLH